MSMFDRIVNSFYYHIVPDASRGKMLTNWGVYNICYNTVVPSEDMEYLYEKNDIFVPTLLINDKEKFDKCLVDYVKVATEFYGDADENIVMATLFFDATNEDFCNPIDYINRKKNFILDSRLDSLKEGILLGYSEILDGNIYVQLSKDHVFYETPYVLETSLFGKNGGYNFPGVSFGIEDNKAYIYSIQKRDVSTDKSLYEKKVNRALFKIGEGFDSKKDNYEKYDVGNLKDVSASFVVVSSILLGILENMGINEIILPSVRIVRWNNKVISKDDIVKRNRYDSKLNLQLESDMIRNQSNMTDKFLRTFLRLAHHFDGLDVISYPFEMDSNLRMNSSFDLVCNNSLLREVYELGKSFEMGDKHVSK